MGKHNILNSVAAISVCLNLGVKTQIIKKALKKFSGVQRRMTKIFEKNNNEFYDDYAHHPTEIFSVLEGVKKISNEKKLQQFFNPIDIQELTCLKKNLQVLSNFVIG